MWPRLTKKLLARAKQQQKGLTYTYKHRQYFAPYQRISDEKMHATEKSHYYYIILRRHTHSKIIFRATSCDDDKNIGGKQNKRELLVIIAIIKKEPSPSLYNKTHTHK